MKRSMLVPWSFLLLLAIVLVVACTPAAAPTPTAAPTKAAAPAPAAPTPTAVPPAKPTATAAPAAKPFYEGKTITWVVGDSAGGALDTYARPAAPYLTKQIPGNPRIIVQNLPGGGGITAINEMYNTVSRDGLTISLSAGGFNLGHLLRTAPGARKYKLEDMPVIASSGTYVEQHVAPGVSGIKSASDLLKLGRPFRVCDIIPGTYMTVLPSLFLEPLAVEWKMVYGFQGIANINLAMERNECDLGIEDLTGYFANVKERAAKGEYLPLFQSGTLDAAGNVVRYPAFAEIPTYSEVYLQLTGKPMPAANLAGYKSAVAAALMGKLILVPPGTPSETVNTLREAFARLRQDQEYMAAFKKQNVVEDPLLTASEAERMLKVVLTTPADIIDFMRKVTGVKD